MTENRKDQLREITGSIEQGIQALFQSDRYQEYLRVMSHFHNYSLNNTLLIAMQRPDATLVAGYKKWIDQFGRNVRKGEKGIKILAPAPYKVKKEMQKLDAATQKPLRDKDGKPVTEQVEFTIPTFKIVSVFDVSQTEGKELPSVGVNALTQDVEQYDIFFSALEKTSPVPVQFENIKGGTQGYYHLIEKRIALLKGASQLQTLKTLVHEIAHAKLHAVDSSVPVGQQQSRPDRYTREVQAESIAYTVCQHYGLDTSDYSFGYIAGWSTSHELSELKGSLETIHATAAELISTVDEHFSKMQKERLPKPSIAEKLQSMPTKREPTLATHAIDARRER